MRVGEGVIFVVGALVVFKVGVALGLYEGARAMGKLVGVGLGKLVGARVGRHEGASVIVGARVLVGSTDGDGDGGKRSAPSEGFGVGKVDGNAVVGTADVGGNVGAENGFGEGAYEGDPTGTRVGGGVGNDVGVVSAIHALRV